MLRILLALALFQPAVAQKPEWKGTIATENNVKVIHNPETPLYGALKLDLQEEISIGRENDKNRLFWLIQELQIDNAGRFYVDDVRNFRIQVFDRNGNFVRTIGRRGQGPGEFQQPTRLRIHALSNRLYVRDILSRRISIFGFLGNYLGSVPTKHIVLDYYPLETSAFMAVQSVFSESDLTEFHSLAIIDLKGTIIKESMKFQSNPWVERTSGGIAGGTTGYEFKLCLDPLEKEQFVYGFSKDYKLTIVDKDLNPLCQISKAEPPPVLTREEMELFKKVPSLKAKPYFFAILSDSCGRIYVQRNFPRNKNTVQDDVPKNFDIFGNDGSFLYTTSLPPNTQVIRDGYLYSFSVDWEEGLESVHRYRIKNWDQIKEKNINIHG